MHSLNAPDTEKHHDKIGFSAEDHTIYHAALQGFAHDAKGRQQSYQTLLTTLSPEGQAKLRKFIQAEKARMQYRAQEVIEQ